MRAGYSLDVGWLITQGEADALAYHRTLGAIMKMKASNTYLLFDSEGRIRGEYERCLPTESLGRKIYMHAIKMNMIGYYSGVPSSRSNDVLDRLGFDPSDRPYIGVAENAQGAYVTHESKHLDESVVEAINCGCSVDVLDSELFFD